MIHDGSSNGVPAIDAARAVAAYTLTHRPTALEVERLGRGIVTVETADLRYQTNGRDSATIHLAHRPLVPQPIAQCRRVWPSAVTVAFALGMALGVAAAVVTLMIRAGVTK